MSVVLGRLIEQGTHEELNLRKGLYFTLVRAQESETKPVGLSPKNQGFLTRFECSFVNFNFTRFECSFVNFNFTRFDCSLFSY